MNQYLGLSFALLSAAAFVAARRMNSYSEGKRDGFKDGYREGFTDAREISELWWDTADRQVRETRDKIQDEERWP